MLPNYSRMDWYWNTFFIGEGKLARRIKSNRSLARLPARAAMGRADGKRNKENKVILGQPNNSAKRSVAGVGILGMTMHDARSKALSLTHCTQKNSSCSNYCETYAAESKSSTLISPASKMMAVESTWEKNFGRNAPFLDEYLRVRVLGSS